MWLIHTQSAALLLPFFCLLSSAKIRYRLCSCCQWSQIICVWFTHRVLPFFCICSVCLQMQKKSADCRQIKATDPFLTGSGLAAFCLLCLSYRNDRCLCLPYRNDRCLWLIRVQNLCLIGTEISCALHILFVFTGWSDSGLINTQHLHLTEKDLASCLLSLCDWDRPSFVSPEFLCLTGTIQYYVSWIFVIETDEASCLLNLCSLQGRSDTPFHKSLWSRQTKHRVSWIFVPCRDDPILRLMKIRNPWGRGDFTGAWSPKSEYWKKYEQIAIDCKFNEYDLGVFVSTF